MFVHSTAVVSSGARIGANCHVGPYCVIGCNVVLEAGVKLLSHCIVGDSGDVAVTIGENSELHPYSVVGGIPQDKKHRAGMGQSRVRLGRQCVVREHATINGGTSGAGLETTVGAGSLVLTGAHIGHDCKVGENVVLSNQVQLAGHVHVGDKSVIGGQSVVRQWVKIGRGAMVGGASAVDRHVLPYSLVQGNRAVLRNANLVGLRRSGVSRKDIFAIRDALLLLKKREDLVSSTSVSFLKGPNQCDKLNEIAQFALGCTSHKELEPTLERNSDGAIAWTAVQRGLGLVL